VNTTELPHNVEIEQSLLGAILVNNDAFYRVSDTVKAEHFYEPIHQQIFSVAAGLIQAGKKASPVTIKTFIPAETDIAGLNPAQYLGRLAAEATSVLNADDYARNIYALHLRRELIRVSDELAEKAFNLPVDKPVESLISEIEDELLSLTPEAASEGFIRFSEALAESVDMAARAYQREGGLSGIATGLADLDHLMGGLQKSDLIVVAGRPAMGKTAFATNIAYEIAQNYEGQPRPDGSIETVSGGIVGFFSLEMSAEQLSTRILSERLSIPSSRIRRGEIKEHEFKNISQEAQRNNSVPLYTEQTGGLTISQIMSRARRLHRQRGLDLLIVDYLQLVFGTQKQGANRVNELSEITGKLKGLAKELNVPIIALSQLSRAVEQREDKRPMLSDLRESGSIEQDADVVMFLYREEYYLKNKEPKAGTEEWFKWETAMKACAGKAQIIVSKQRHGPTGIVDVSFEPTFTRFGNLAREASLPERRPTSFKEREVA
jgi:replicative DNA helicase